MATQNRLTNSQWAAMRRQGRVGRGGQSRNSGSQRGSRLKLSVDVSDLASRLQGITFDNVVRLKEFKSISLHRGLQARDATRSMVRPLLKNDPREAYRGISLGLSIRNEVALYVNIHDTRSTETRNWNPVRKHKNTKRTRSQDTIRYANYFGRSRAFLLRILDGGTQVRKTGQTGRWNRGAKEYIVRNKHGHSGANLNRGKISAMKFFNKNARKSLYQIRDEWLSDVIELIDKTFRK